ncbi:hypothetical protein [Actinoplanes sp. NBRC 103695]|uniref:hypothetical protein n=1 Tax=Actinoplanes sp. NBRC 103695 TaxID=3032202 RepID=UPI0024A18668|nr:hypothetical protein [Actinoplanes sp. NBRC 103695]GLZ01543.1 hypothetical protein Acsp02_87940 [Actinoplanes sp. NBRC 103695]
MTDLEVRDALHRATAEVTAPADLLDRVTAGGRRRVVRRRSLLTAGLAVVGAGATAAVLRGGGGQGLAPPASDLLDGPARGDLAGDSGFLTGAVATFRSSLPDDLATMGPPRVAWAVSAPAGGLALVAQRLRPRDLGDGSVEFGVIRFVEMWSNGTRIWTAGRLEPMITGRYPSNAYLVGGVPGDAFLRFRDFFRDARPERTLVVLDDGRPVRIATSFTVDASGRLVWQYRDLPLPDGFARVVRGQAGLSVRAGGRGVVLGNDIDASGRTKPLIEADLGGADDRRLRGYDDETAYFDASVFSPWRIRGVTPDGRSFVVQTLVEAGTIRLFRFLDGPEPTYLGVVPGRSQSALATRLPDEQGIVFASKRSRFRHRSARGDWVLNPDNAGLLPPGTVEIRYPDGTNEAVLTIPA